MKKSFPIYSTVAVSEGESRLGNCSSANDDGPPQRLQRVLRCYLLLLVVGFEKEQKLKTGEKYVVEDGFRPILWRSQRAEQLQR